MRDVAAPRRTRFLAAAIAVGVLFADPVWVAHDDADAVAFGSLPIGRNFNKARGVRPLEEIATISGALGVRSHPRRPWPVHLSIPAIDVVAPVSSVGVARGVAEVPSEVSTVGWYRYGPSPGEKGSSVLVGHVASMQGGGAFYRLHDLQVGDVISVLMSDGGKRLFIIQAARSYLKSELPAFTFRRRGRPILMLITCGGAYDESMNSYEDNVVVLAVPKDL